MLDITDVENDIKGTTYNATNGNTDAEIVQFPRTQVEQQIEHSVGYHQNTYIPSTSIHQYEAKRAPLQTHRIPRSDISQKALSEDNKKQLREALFRITDSIDHEFSFVERSNCFDEWKDLLELVARKANHLTINHSEILGTLISIVHHRDVSDYSIEVLKMFRDATSTLRQPRVTKEDSKRILDKLFTLGIKTTIPLATDNLQEDQIDKLDHMISVLVEKSTSNK